MFFPKTSKLKKGFTLVDLVIAIFISSILLIGVFKAFMSNLKTTTKTLDLTVLDAKTRKVVSLLQSDINDLNGNILNGTPTVFPLFNSDGENNGLALIKPVKKAPIFNQSLDRAAFPYDARAVETKLYVASAIPSLDASVFTPGRYLIVHNFGNYTWIPFQICPDGICISNFVDNGDGTFEIPVIHKAQVSSGAPEWSPYLTTTLTRGFDGYLVNRTGSATETVRDGSYTLKINTVYYLADIIHYILEDDKLVRILNPSLKSGINPTKTVVANGVSEFKPTFTTLPSQIYPDSGRVNIEKKTDFTTFIDNLVQGTSSDVDDCVAQINYQCKNTVTNNLNVIGYSYAATRINGIHIKLDITNETGRQKEIRLFFSLDENHGNSALLAFSPTKVLATKEASDRQYGSLIANPSMYGDPEGGAASSPFFIAAAPMISAVSKNEDSANDSKVVSVCENCDSRAVDCGLLPEICSSDKNDNGLTDYTECATANLETRMLLGCISPQGTLNDRSLNAANNRIDPKLVFLNELSEIKPSSTLDLSSSCSGSCPLASYYTHFGANTDNIFPMTVLPHWNATNELDRIYVGVARLRIPELVGGKWNYYPEYNSVVFAIDTHPDNPETPPDLAFYRGHPIIWDEGAKQDIASVSSLQIRDETIDSEAYEYMYLSSHETHSVMFRKRLKKAVTDDTTWSVVSKAFENPDTLRTKFTWLYHERQPDDSLAEKFAAFPETAWDPMSEGAPDPNRITAMLAHEDGRIYFTTAQRLPDQMINGDLPDTDGNQWFYEHEITYHTPVITDTGEILQCLPGNEEAGCTMPAGIPKPIDWAYCKWVDDNVPGETCYKNPDGSYSSEFPLSTAIRPSFDAKLKVALKVDDTNWTIKTIANLHDTATGIAMDPTTGDILVSAPTNLRRFSYEEINYLIAENLTPPDVDLGFRRNVDNLYTANNIVDALIDPDSPADSIEIKRLSGINIHPNSKRLNIVFADMVNREVGYIVQEHNLNRKHLFAQIVYNDWDPQGNTDRNLDMTVIHEKGSVDLHEGFAYWVLPFTSTKAWADPTRLSPEGKPQFPISSPPPLRPPSNITDYSVAMGGAHTRKISENPTTCYADPMDPRVCPPGGSCYCGQDLLFRSCEGDVLSQVSIGLMGRQDASYGCGVGAPSPYVADDPMELPVPSEQGGGTKLPGLGEGGEGGPI